jgi:hypothetical protein
MSRARAVGKAGGGHCWPPESTYGHVAKALIPSFDLDSDRSYGAKAWRSTIPGSSRLFAGRATSV